MRGSPRGGLPTRRGSWRRPGSSSPPGRELDAATVNDVVKARPENVVPATVDDPNWRAFGDGLAVLVVLGPAGT